jgi:hypothetical protein
MHYRAKYDHDLKSAMPVYLNLVCGLVDAQEVG